MTVAFDHNQSFDPGPSQPDPKQDPAASVARPHQHQHLPAFLLTPPPRGGVFVSTPQKTGRKEEPRHKPNTVAADPGAANHSFNQEHKVEMGKKSARKHKYSDDSNAVQLHAISGGWDPLNRERGYRDSHSREDQRDQSFVRTVKPRSDNQAQLMEAIESKPLTLALGPAGTGKTYLAIACAVKKLEAGKIDRIILSRPAIEAGEALGYLPGTMEEKMSPYLRPLYDALSDRMGGKRLRACLSDGTIEIAPIAYMRGRTLNNSFVVIDEAQNCTYGQIKMLLTRLGWHSHMVITGDPDQTDLLPGLSGLMDIAKRLETVADAEIVKLGPQDVVRHPLVACMLAVL
jgi:phosphate starvation-inducible protein PhoH and related proteins